MSADEPATDTIKVSPTAPRVPGMIMLTDTEGSMVFKPLEDITPYELALLLNLLARLLTNPDVFRPADWRGYIREHMLGRHFKAP